MENTISEDLHEIDEILDNDFEVVQEHPDMHLFGDKRHANLKQNNPVLMIPKEKMEVNSELLIEEFANESPYIWGINYRCLKGRPLNYEGEHLVQRRPFLIQPLEDMSSYKGYRKARQVGVSENSVTEALWFMDINHHSKVCYVLPSGRQVQDFSNTRVAPAIDESSHLKDMKGDIQNVNLKQLRDSFLFLRSGALERLGEGIDSDVTMFDELDRMSPRIKVAFEESLQSSRWGWIRDISTPSVPNFGVDVGWEKSKQWHWYISCEHCGKKQQLTWLPDEEYGGKTSIEVNKFNEHFYICKHCGKEILVDARSKGEWVAKFPERSPSFYQISQLMAPWITAEALWLKQESYPFKQLFFNYCLGIPYLGDNILVTEGMIINALSKDPRISFPVPESYMGRIAVGVDWGEKSYVTVGTLYKGKPLIIDLVIIDANDPDEHPRQVAAIMARYNADIAVCDAGYGRDRNAKLLKMFPEKIFSCFYPSSDKGSKIFEPQWQDDQGKVSIDRTNSLKLNLSYFKSGDCIIARNIENKLFQRFVKHLCNMLSVKDMDDKTQAIEEWIASSGADHFGHSYNYMMTAIAKFDKLPKSEYFDGAKEIAAAQKENRLKNPVISNPNPEVPGFADMSGLINLSSFKGISHGECYMKSYDATSEKCFNCSQKTSCKNMMGE